MDQITGYMTDTPEKISGALSSLGIRGYSAYEIAVKHGYTGTEEEWLDSFDMSKIRADIDKKVDKVSGKALSTNDYTNEAKRKVDAIPTNPKYTDTVYDDSGIRSEIEQIKENELTESDIAKMGFTKNTGTYSKPSGGIPESDLSAAVKTKLNNSAVSSVNGKTGAVTLNASDVGALPNTTVIPKAYDDTALKNDVSNAKLLAEAKYAKPSGGIPESDLSAGVRTKLNSVPDPYDDAAVKADISALKTGKQDTITDLADIRSGAAKGATAIQEHQSLSGYAKESWVESKGYLTEHQDISGKADKSTTYTKTEVDGKLATAGKVKMVNNIEPDENGNIDLGDIPTEEDVRALKEEIVTDIDSATENTQIAHGSSVETYEILEPSDIAEVKESLSALEQLMPEANPTVGKVLKVLSVNEDGTFVCEWADEKETDLTGYVKNTDYATANKGGVTKINTAFGFGIGESGTAYLQKASDTQIDARQSSYNPIVPANLEKAVTSVVDFKAGGNPQRKRIVEESDLEHYVKDTDYPTGSKAGIISASSTYGFGMRNSKYLAPTVFDTAGYSSALDCIALSKGTLENIKEDLVKSVGDEVYAKDGNLEFIEEVVLEEETSAVEFNLKSIGKFRYIRVEVYGNGTITTQTALCLNIGDGNISYVDSNSGLIRNSFGARTGGNWCIVFTAELKNKLLFGEYVAVADNNSLSMNVSPVYASTKYLDIDYVDRFGISAYINSSYALMKAGMKFRIYGVRT